MRKLLVSVFLLVVVLFIVGCESTSRGEGEYKLTVIDDFGYLTKPLDSYYKAGEDVEVHLVFLSGPSAGIKINGEYIDERSAIKYDGANPIVSFIMPAQDSVLYTTMNGYILKDCGNKKHTWGNEVHTISQTNESYYQCTSCGKKKEIENPDIAKIILEYEQEEKEKIKGLLKTKPEYIYYFNPVGQVSYTYAFKDSNSVDQIIEKYDLTKLCSEAKIYNWSSIKMLCFSFGRNQFTEKIYQELQKIKEKESVIEDVYITLEPNYVASYVPNIDYYINKKEELPCVTENKLINYGDKSFIIKTKKEYDDYLDYLLEITEYEYQKNNINNRRDLYDETFFEENALVISSLVVRGSGSIKLTVDNVYKSDNKIYIVIRTDEPGIGTCDMQYRTFSFIVKQSDVKDVNEVITLE